MNTTTLVKEPVDDSVDLRDALLANVRAILQVGFIDPEAPLLELGVDSVNIVEIMMSCEAIFGVNVLESDIVFDQHTTIQSLGDELCKRLV
jgi:acyl carrier protein